MMSRKARNDQDSDFIVLDRRVVTIVGAVLIFLAGGLVGYFLAKFTSNDSAQQSAGIQIDTDGDPQIGPDDAKVTIVEFSDFQCFYCKRFRDTTLDALVEKYGDNIRFVYRDYPLPMHPQAQAAAEAAECANEQGKFWEMHDLLFANQEVLSDDAYAGFAGQLGLNTQQFGDCLSNHKYAGEVAADQQDANAYGVSGAPAFFVNEQMVVGAQPLSVFESLVDQELNK
jgi:protein-disulfide isomerase